MKFYQILEKLTECTPNELRSNTVPYVAILTEEEWENYREEFDMGIDFEPSEEDVLTTKAVENFDSITGSFLIPNRSDFSGAGAVFTFALDEKGVVFIDNNDEAQSIIDEIIRNKKWRMPGLERFLYDFLDSIIAGDQQLIRDYEKELDTMEDMILHDEEGITPERLNVVRGDVRELLNHYEQLLDLTEVLEENENDFFREDNVRYFRLYAKKIERLRDMSAALRDHTMQVRDIYKTHLDVRQNNIMTILTVVTTIFMPLTVIVGWYGMNFIYMPELAYRISYPVVIAVSAIIVIGEIIFFKRRKWL